MKNRSWILAGVFAGLLLAYVIFFTDWLRPEPIQVVSELRLSVLPPHFGRVAPKKPAGTNNAAALTNKLAKMAEAQAAKLAEAGFRESAGDGAYVTFSLDDAYQLTHLQVEDVPADGSAPKTVWLLKGKSMPVRALMYGRDPEGMIPVLAGQKAEPLKAGVPYRLIIEAGRRRGTNNFTTVPRVSE